MSMVWQNKRVLITGASGYIGRLLCRELSERGCVVTALLRTPQDGPWRDAIVADLGRTVIDPSELEGVEVIFHLAGKAHVRARSVEEIREYETIHVAGTRALLDAAVEARVRQFVLMSSLSVMGESGGEVWDESHACRPSTPYGVSKLEAEKLVLGARELHCPVVLRPALVYGAGSKGNLDALVRAARRGVLPRIEFPDNGRSMVHVEDVVQACILAASSQSACGKTYIVTDGLKYSTNQILEWINTALNTRPKFAFPYTFVRFGARCGDILEKAGLPAPLTRDRLAKMSGSALYSNQKICRELGFAPKWNLRQGIAQMVGHAERK